MTGNLLSLAIWLPIVAGLIVLATGSDKNAPAARWLALAGALASFLVTIPLYLGFDTFHGGQPRHLQSDVPLPRISPILVDQ